MGTPLIATLAAFALAAGDVDIAVTPVRTEAAARTNRIGRIMELPKTPESPTIDGRLDEACWRKAAVVSDFVSLGGETPAKKQTTARVTYDGRALYLAFVCQEPQVAKILALRTKHDQGVWEDDCVEVFLDTNHDHTTYYQFIVNSIGTRLDARWTEEGRLDVRWNCQWEAKATTHADRWDVEIAIPFESIGARPGVWGINLCREEHVEGELSCWAPQMKRFAAGRDELALFGDAVFEEVPFVLTHLNTGNHGWGRNVLRLEVANRLDRDARWEVGTTVIAPDGKASTAKAMSIALAPKARKPIELPYEIARLVPGRWRLDVSLRDPATGQACSAGSFPVEVTDVSPFVVRRRIIVGPDYIVPAALHARLGSLTARDASCRVSVRGPKGRVCAERSLRLYPHDRAQVEIDISRLPEGRYAIAAGIFGKDGRPVTDEFTKGIVKIPGPFEEIDRASPDLVTNGSFERSDEKGQADAWVGRWWAPKQSGRTAVPVSDFLALDATTAKHGRRSIRITSTRGGNVATGEVLMVTTAPRIPITPGISYKLTCYWKSLAIVGIGKVWAQTPKRQFVFRGTINGSHPDWTLLDTTFTPDRGETWCQLNFALHGKDGTLWVDEITFGEEPPAIERVLPPNAFKREGICLLSGNTVDRGLKLAIEAHDAASGTKTGRAETPVNGRATRFVIPGMTLDRRHLVTVRLLDGSGRTIDAHSAPALVAPLAE